MSGHEGVKAALAAHLADHIAEWVALTVVDAWPATPSLVAVTDLLPADEDKPWPCVLVSSTGMPRIRHTGSLGEDYLAEYTLTITVGVRSDESRNYDKATVGRDRLLLAVRWLLMAHPRLAAGTVALVEDLTETTDPVAMDTKGRPVALGKLSLTIRTAESVPDPATSGPIAPGDVAVTVYAVAADQDLP